MEFLIVIRLLIKRWWVIFLTSVITVVSTLIFTNSQIPIYASVATYVVSPSPGTLTGASYVNGLAVLGGQPTVTNTYASIAASSLIKQKASDVLGLSPTQVRSLSVDSRVQNGTNVIEITVKGEDPLLVQIFANKIGESTIDYIAQLDGVYNMKPLDTAKSPDGPTSPNERLNLTLGVAFGIVLGGGLAFLFGLKDY